jgi:hypothetical protein
MAARGDREGAVGAPELSGVLDLEAFVPEPLLRLGVIRGDHGGVPEHGSGVALGEDQVDLRSPSLQPADRAAEWLGRIDLLESEEPPELNGAVSLLRGNLERDVLEHSSRTA